jgi:hypothetical protein
MMLFSPFLLSGVIHGWFFMKQKRMEMSKKTWLITGAVVLGLVLLSSMFFIPFEVAVIKEVYSVVVSEIVNTTGLSQTLVKGIVIVLLAPLLWIVPLLFKKRHKYNKYAWLSVLGYFSVFFITMYFLTKDIVFRHDDKGPLKWYALTPDGPKYYDSPGIDPVYGIKLKPVTPDVIRQLKLVGKGDFKQVDPEKVSLFNPITGEPQAWYYQSGTGEYEFYDKPGYYPMSGEPLLPVTKEIYQAWLKSKAALKATTATSNAAGVTEVASGASDKNVEKASGKSKNVHNKSTGNFIKEEDW